ncbi:hypothetical protein ACHAQA_009683 [Verticillium albo-atrum]
MATSLKSAWKIIPSLQSKSIENTVKFYTEELGFFLGGTEPSEGTPYFCSVAAGPKAAANIYFFHATAEEFKAGGAMIAVGTDEVDAFYNYLKTREAVKIAEEIEDKPWGYRQFSILDQDGNRLTFFRFLEGGNPGKDESD